MQTDFAFTGPAVGGGLRLPGPRGPFHTGGPVP